jgi:hypothetical protein
VTAEDVVQAFPHHAVAQDHCRRDHGRWRQHRRSTPLTGDSGLSRSLPRGKNPGKIFSDPPHVEKPRAIKDLGHRIEKIEGVAGNRQGNPKSPRIAVYRHSVIAEMRIFN